MYYVSAQGVDERMINVHCYYYYSVCVCVSVKFDGFAVAVAVNTQFIPMLPARTPNFCSFACCLLGAHRHKLAGARRHVPAVLRPVERTLQALLLLQPQDMRDGDETHHQTHHHRHFVARLQRHGAKVS